MCDYSIESFASRDAVKGDKLIVREFTTGSRGFCSLDAPDVAVCVKPNTEIGFDAPVAFYDRGKLETSEFAVAMFVQVNLGKRLQHHDALQFPDGSIIKLTTLKAGQYAHILQVPVELTRRLDAACQNVFKAYEEFLEGVKD